MSAFLVAAVDWIVGMTALTALVYVAARVAERALAGRVSARLRMALYLALVARMLLPVRWSGGLHVVDGAVAKATRVVPTIAPTSESVALRVVEIVTGTGLPWPAFVASGVYVAGVVALLLVRGLARRGLSTGLRPARPSLAASSSGASVFESDDFGPVVVGVLRPRIVVPSWLADSLDADAMRWIVRHETAHVAARDPLLLGAAQFVAIALWPVAPIWFALRRVRALMEVACDERTLVGSSDSERSAFMRVQTQVATMQTRRVRVLGAPGFGGDLGERMRACATAARRWPRVAQTAIVGVVVAALVACASSTSAADSDGPADYMLVSVTRIPDEYVVDGDGTGLHLVGARLVAISSDAPMTLRASKEIEMSDANLTFHADRVAMEGALPSSSGWVRFGGDVDLGPSCRTVGAPMLIVRDGEAGAIAIGWGEKASAENGYRAEFTVTPASDGVVDLAMSFKQRVGGETVREIANRTIRVREGDSYLIPTRRLDGSTR
jgi:beta-lactamase regulating signal transducer with metallopeptidase domain